MPAGRPRAACRDARAARLRAGVNARIAVRATRAAPPLADSDCMDDPTDILIPLLPPFPRAARAGRRCAGARRTCRARSGLAAAAQLHAVDADALAQLTGALVSRQRTADALALAECAARVQPGATAYFNHGYALQMAGRHADAVAPYRAALALDADRPSLRNNPRSRCGCRAAAARRDRAARSGGALRSTRRCRRGLISSSRGSRRTDAALACAARLVGRARQRARDEQRRAGDEGGAALGRRRALRGTRVRAGARRRVVPFQPWRSSSSCAATSRPAGAVTRRAGTARANARPPAGAARRAGRASRSPARRCSCGASSRRRAAVLPLRRAARRARAPRGGRLVWNTFPLVGTLMQRSLGPHADAFSAGGGIESLPAFDYEVPLIGLPLMLGMEASTLASSVPYLRADPHARDAWRARLAGDRRLKVGRVDGQRGAPAQSVPGGSSAMPTRSAGSTASRFIRCSRARTRMSRRRAAGFAIEDVTAELTSFDDTAAFIGALDLVITVCTSVAPGGCARRAHLGAARRESALAVAARTQGQPVVPERDVVSATGVRRVGAGDGGGEPRPAAPRRAAGSIGESTRQA